MSSITWLIDATRSSIRFEVKHMLISTASGYFTGFEGSLTTPDPEGFEPGNISLTIFTDSLSTNEAYRDEHLKSDEFLDVAHYPQIRFRSASFRKTADGTFTLLGDLMIREREKRVQMKATLLGMEAVEGTTEASFSVSGILNRKDFGLTYGPLMEAGGMIVSDEITVLATIRLTKQ